MLLGGAAAAAIAAAVRSGSPAAKWWEGAQRGSLGPPWLIASPTQVMSARWASMAVEGKTPPPQHSAPRRFCAEHTRFRI